MKIACLFAGQGAQYPGMGRDLYEKYEKSRRVFDEAGEKIKQLCFEGTAEELKLTENTQPCVYTVTMAAYEEFFSRFQAQKPEDAEIAAMAGFSLGEYAALTAAGVISGIADGVELMEHRGRYMGEAGSRCHRRSCESQGMRRAGASGRDSRGSEYQCSHSDCGFRRPGSGSALYGNR